MTSISALVVVASNRAADGVYEDTSGPVLVQGFAAAGFGVAGPLVVHDGEEVEQALRDAVDDGFDLVVTSGGTGLTSLDLTPEMTRRVIEREVPGIGEAIRAVGRATTPFAALSRGVAGVAGTTLIVNIAGSSGAAKDALSVLTGAFVRHAVSQLHDGDHARSASAQHDYDAAGPGPLGSDQPGSASADAAPYGDAPAEAASPRTATPATAPAETAPSATASSEPEERGERA